MGVASVSVGGIVGRIQGFKWIIPVATGAVAFIMVTTGKVLWPTNIAWLQENDLALNYLASSYFRWSPWTLPPGANPNYGLEIGNATCYSITAFPFDLLFKTMSGWLPDPFQYWGMWLACSFVLQAYCGWRLIGLFSSNITHRCIAAAFFVFSPPFIFRFFHPTLGAHWTLLIALILAFSPESKWKWLLWPFHLCLVATISAYLFAMVAALWFADWLGRWLDPHLHQTHQIPEGFLCLTLPIVGLWMTGLFTIHEGKTALGYGTFKMNLLSLVNPRGWSYMIPDTPATYGEWDGYQYLGLGLILLSVIALVHVNPWRIKIPIRRIPLMVMVVFLTAFAITPHVGIGGYEISIPVPSWVFTTGNHLRGSGRFFWPVFYLCILSSIVVVSRRYSSRVATLLFSVTLAIQIFDTSAGWLQVRDYLSQVGNSWETPLKSSFWEEAAGHYGKVRLVRSRVGPFGSARIPFWKDIAFFALTHRKGTDSVYLTRTDTTQRAILKGKNAQMLHEGVYESDSLYIFEDEEHYRMFTQNIPSGTAQNHLLTQIDGFWVFAPGWNRGIEHIP
jgi:hypothetical protein